jgi:hypothetical protein
MNDQQQKSEWVALDEIPNLSASGERLPAVLLPGKEESFTASGKELFPRLATIKRYFMLGTIPNLTLAPSDQADLNKVTAVSVTLVRK